MSDPKQANFKFNANVVPWKFIKRGAVFKFLRKQEFKKRFQAEKTELGNTCT